MRALLTAACTALVVALVAGCGENPTPGAASGYYAGSGGGLGAAADYRAEDPTGTRIRALVKPRGLRVVVAYVVNHSDRPQLTPTFRAELFDGRIVNLPRADRDSQVSRTGLPVPRVIGVDDATTIYLLTKERPEAVTSIVMRRADGKTVRLQPKSVN